MKEDDEDGEDVDVQDITMDSIEIPTIDDVFGSITEYNTGVTIVESPKASQNLQADSASRITGVGFSIFAPRASSKPNIHELTRATETKSDSVLIEKVKTTLEGPPVKAKSAGSVPSKTASSDNLVCDNNSTPVPGAPKPEPEELAPKQGKVPAIAVPLKVDQKTGMQRERVME